MKMLFDQKVAIVTPIHKKKDEDLINERISEMNKEGWDLQKVITEQAYDLSTHESPPKVWNQWQQWTLIFRRPVQWEEMQE